LKNKEITKKEKQLMNEISDFKFCLKIGYANPISDIRYSIFNVRFIAQCFEP